MRHASWIDHACMHQRSLAEACMDPWSPPRWRTRAVRRRSRNATLVNHVASPPVARRAPALAHAGRGARAGRAGRAGLQHSMMGATVPRHSITKGSSLLTWRRQLNFYKAAGGLQVVSNVLMVTGSQRRRRRVHTMVHTSCWQACGNLRALALNVLACARGTHPRAQCPAPGHGLRPLPAAASL